MQIGLCFLLNSARCTVHFKNCFGAVGNLLCYCCLVFVIVESCWFGKATTLHQRRMAVLRVSHLSSSENKCCFCFSFSRMSHCSHTSIMLNLQVSCDTGCFRQQGDHCQIQLPTLPPNSQVTPLPLPLWAKIRHAPFFPMLLLFVLLKGNILR